MLPVLFSSDAYLIPRAGPLRIYLARRMGVRIRERRERSGGDTFKTKGMEPTGAAAAMWRLEQRKKLGTAACFPF